MKVPSLCICIAENQKKLAAEGFFEYLKALLSSKVVIDSVQGLAKNPTALGLDSIGPITTLASNLPKMVSQSTSSTTTIIKYLSANGIDTSKMQKEADSLYQEWQAIYSYLSRCNTADRAYLSQEARDIRNDLTELNAGLRL